MRNQCPVNLICNYIPLCNHYEVTIFLSRYFICIPFRLEQTVIAIIFISKYCSFKNVFLNHISYTNFEVAVVFEIRKLKD